MRISMEEVQAILTLNEARNLRDPKDRTALAYFITTEINHKIDMSICDRCGHLEEVHLPSECIAGCETECSCEGFHKEEDEA